MNKKNSLTSKDLIELTIDSLSYNGGRGVGRFEGIVVFVGDVVPGDIVRARVTAKKSKLWEAELVEVLKASPYRRVPPCPVAQRCGGCSWQQVEYDQQVVQKEKILSDALRNLRRYGEWEHLPFLRAPEEFHYRNRIQVHTRGGRTGFYASRTRDLVPFDKCWIADEKINSKFRDSRFVEGSKTEIALNESGQVMVFEGERDPAAALFSQVNSAQNEILKSRLLALIDHAPVWLMDLYAGSGNLTLPLAKKFPSASITAIEFSRRSVERGQALLPRVRWIAADTAEGLRQLTRPEGRGVVVLDPPRTGVSSQVIDELRRLAPQQIVYVSCNPMTFARDVEKLVQKGDFRLGQVQGLDMFPQTEHVELIATLSGPI